MIERYRTALSELGPAHDDAGFLARVEIATEIARQLLADIPVQVDPQRTGAGRNESETRSLRRPRRRSAPRCCARCCSPSSSHPTPIARLALDELPLAGFIAGAGARRVGRLSEPDQAKGGFAMLRTIQIAAMGAFTGIALLALAMEWV